jgi:hypothetical protein
VKGSSVCLLRLRATWLRSNEVSHKLNDSESEFEGVFNVDFQTQAIADNVILRFERYHLVFAGWDYSGQWRLRQQKLVHISVAETVAVFLRYAQATFITCLFVQTSVSFLPWIVSDANSFAAEWPCRMHRNSILTFREIAIAVAGRLKGVVGWLGKTAWLLWSDMKAQGCPSW